MYKTILTTLIATLTGVTVASAMHAGQSINEMEEKKMNDKKENLFIRGEKAIENGVVKGYKAIENGVVKGYKAIEDAFVDAFFTEDPRVEQAAEEQSSEEQANEAQTETTEA